MKAEGAGKIGELLGVSTRLLERNQDENGWNARPHPGPLPRGEGESFAGSLECRALELAGESSSNPQTAMAAPSPGGEGWDEGERETFFNATGRAEIRLVALESNLSRRIR
jgi:hypothetical protein